MNFILSLIYAIQAIRHISVLNACIRTRRDLEEPFMNPESCGNAPAYIVVPLFEEQDAVLDILNYFLPQLDAQTRLVLVTSERERVVSRPGTRTTEEVIATSVRDSKVIHLHDPK